MFEKFNQWARTSITLKMIIIGILILVLLIPTNMVEKLIHERESTRNTAVKEVASKWGLDQTIGTPVITIPYMSTVTNSNGQKQTITQYAHILPDDIQIETEVIPEKRYRGMYVVVLYNTKATIKGSFKSSMEQLQKMTNHSLKLDQAYIELGISDLKGVKDAVSFTVDGNQTYEFNPGVPSTDIYYSGISLPFNITEKDTFSFECALNLNGSTSLYFQPYGKQTVVKLHTTWTNPSFEGSFLPDTRQISDSGTSATWKILQLNRNYPQYGLGDFIRTSEQASSAQVVYDDYTVDSYGGSGSVTGQSNSSFGLRLMLPVDEYQKTNRSAKYSIMFILLTIVSFFFIEIINKKRIHPIQYLLIGFGIVLFYILLLSISEHLNFDGAYWIACSAVMILISLYTQSMFRNIKITLLIATILTTLYIFFYSLLQLQDYSLLMGSIGLFIILAITMYMTRNIDWYKDDSVKEIQD